MSEDPGSDIEFKPARRENVSLIIGIAGASGPGKTKSALELHGEFARPNFEVPT